MMDASERSLKEVPENSIFLALSEIVGEEYEWMAYIYMLLFI